MSSVAENAKIMRGWVRVRVRMKIRFRGAGSCWRWFWDARIMRGSNQQVSVRRGEEIWSALVH